MRRCTLDPTSRSEYPFIFTASFSSKLVCSFGWSRGVDQTRQLSNMISQTMKTGFLKRLSVAMVLLLASVSAQAATVNFSSIETLLADPDDMMSAKTALWTGWLTSLYEANMPFIEITNDADDPAIEQFTMTIGDTDYQFSNEYQNKLWTNSYPYAADGTYALLGYSTPDVELVGSITDDGDTLVVDFGDGGLQPGETVRFQVDIDRDADAEGAMLFADYTSVFFTDDEDGQNSFVTMDFAGTDNDASGFLSGSPEGGNDVQVPRPYSEEQVPPTVPPTSLDPIPEPTSVLLLSLAALGLAARRRG